MEEFGTAKHEWFETFLELPHGIPSHDTIGRVHMVSAWASENRLILGQIKTEEKSDEITAIPELLRLSEIRGCIVTIVPK